MGNIAASKLDDFLVATLVGLHTEISPILPRALEWLDYAIANDEDFGEDRNFHRMTLHSARALGGQDRADRRSDHQHAGGDRRGQEPLRGQAGHEHDRSAEQRELRGQERERGLGCWHSGAVQKSQRGALGRGPGLGQRQCQQHEHGGHLGRGGQHRRTHRGHGVGPQADLRQEQSAPGGERAGGRRLPAGRAAQTRPPGGKPAGRGGQEDGRTGDGAGWPPAGRCACARGAPGGRSAAVAGGPAQSWWRRAGWAAWM